MLLATRWSAWGSLLTGLLLPWAALAQSAAPTGNVYTCVNAAGKKLTSDRPIAECIDREQRVLNSDGSVRRVIAASMTADERAEADARAREADADRARRAEAVRRDRNLMMRFPNQVAHDKARAAALDDAQGALQTSEQRLVKLAKERKPLNDEAEFYAGKPLPLALKSQIDANDAAVDAQKALIQNQKIEISRVNALYDVELDHLKKLWAGAPAGSIGVVAEANPAPPVKRR